MDLELLMAFPSPELMGTVATYGDCEALVSLQGIWPISFSQLALQGDTIHHETRANRAESLP